jgi:hypothetical protein
VSKKHPNFCHHVASHGNLCGATPLQHEDYCYFHMLTRERLRRRREADRRKKPVVVPVIQDSSDIQVALTDLANAVLSGALDPSRAYVVLAALQTAKKNLLGLDRFTESGSYFCGFTPEQLHDGTEPDAEEDEEQEAPPQLEPASADDAPAEAAS